MDRLALWRAINAGLRLNAVDESGVNLLVQAAARANNADFVHMLLEHGAEDYFGRVLNLAVVEDKRQAVVDELSA
ncbi:hypothetical protein [Hydrogenophaga sp.]|uniref:hypothetical protein n=1 Tax=Hydrogenophaga sp. TaxID=1904254 RepID=UPI002716747A|nr:hypothetical protein [Hydrogenophaga sp.]MDO9437162.1 hypothetical protein [Hydrogenophaga sp.]